MGYTLFTNVKVALNNVVIDSGLVLYPYRGDFEMRLLNSKDVKEGSLQLMGFDEEVVAFKDVRDIAADFPWQDVAEGTTVPDALAHAALNRQYKPSCLSKSIFLITPIFSEIFDQDKWLPPKTKLFISLEQNKPAFSLLSKSPSSKSPGSMVHIRQQPLLRGISSRASVPCYIPFRVLSWSQPNLAQRSGAPGDVRYLRTVYREHVINVLIELE